MIKRLLVMVLFSGVSTFANSATWYLLNMTTPKSVYFFDKDSLVVNGEMKTIWVQKINIDGKSKENSSKQKLNLFCRSKRYQVLNFINYDKQGSAIGSSSSAGAVEDVPPDTVIDELAKIVCDKKFPNDETSIDYHRVEDPEGTANLLKKDMKKK